jgi:hypothetical protein
MLYLSFRGLLQGQDPAAENTIKQIGKALNAGFGVMVDAWRVNNKLYLGSEQPLYEVTPQYLQNKRFYIAVRNQDMRSWIGSQPSSLYPSWFPFGVVGPYGTSDNTYATGDANPDAAGFVGPITPQMDYRADNIPNPIYQPVDFYGTSNGKIWTYAEVPYNITSIMALPEYYDMSFLSMVNVKAFGICSAFIPQIRRMRNDSLSIYGPFY